MNLDRFLAIVKKYTEIEKLTPTILNEFVEKIIVHAPDKSTGKRVQQVEISYNCVGMIDLPDTNETDSKTAEERNSTNYHLNQNVCSDKIRAEGSECYDGDEYSNPADIGLQHEGRAYAAVVPV